MNENAKKWVAALRSGKYNQGCDYLNNNGEFCCLGVACDLYSKEHDIDIEVRGDVTYYDGENEFLPRIVQDWLGMHSCDGSYGLPHTRTLAIDNDNGKTFDDIASIIEERASELFRE